MVRSIGSSYILKWSKKIKGTQLLGGECIDCGNDNIFILEFHHINPADKDFGINTLKDYTWARIYEEMLKCILICGNCHIKKHSYINNLDKNNRSYNNKKAFLQYKDVNSCQYCTVEFDNLGMVSFHHRDHTTKNFMLSDVRKSFNTLKELPQDIKDELDKCDVMCRNCHKLKHIDVKRFEHNRYKIYKKMEERPELNIIHKDNT